MPSTDLISNNYEVFDEQVHAIAEIQSRAAIRDGKPDLRLGANSCLPEFVLPARLIGALQQARPESVWTFMAAVMTA
jgi:hypothetical protein